MAGLARSVVKWLQSLDLSYQIKNPKWDLANGFLIAEIFSWYYPEEIQMFRFNNGQSLDAKLSNWAILKKFIITKNLNIPNEIIDGSLHCKEGAAILLIETIYQLLTNRPLQKANIENEIDLTDWPYQQKLPFHARSTATRAIKNNIRNTELNTDPSLKLAANKAEMIISRHVEHRKAERDANPVRFDVKKTLAEKCIQRPVPDARATSSSESTVDYYTDQLAYDPQSKKFPSDDSRTDNHVTDNLANFKEIRVKQEAYTNYGLAQSN